MIVACVLRSGGIYTAEHVNRLQAMIDRHMRCGRFVCLTDMEISNPRVERVPLLHAWPGWWAKLEMFRSGIFEAGRPVLYIDLDTVIVGSLQEIVTAAERKPWIVLADFFRQPPRFTHISYGSGLMAFRAGEQQQIYDLFARNPMVRTTCPMGDQQWIEKTAPTATFWQEVVPGQVVSYKVHVLQQGLPSSARVVCFHGKPKPEDVDAQWIREAV